MQDNWKREVGKLSDYFNISFYMFSNFLFNTVLMSWVNRQLLYFASTIS